MLEPLKVEQTVLEVFELSARTEFARDEFITQIDSCALVTRTARGLAFELRAHICGRKAFGAEIRYPATWWDAFKVRWFPRWLRKRFPPVFTVITPEMTEHFPDMKPLRGQRSIVVREFTEPKVRLVP